MSSEQSTDFVIPRKSDCVYTPNFCEENIWHLAKLILETNKSTTDFKCYIVFVSNAKRSVYLWRQNRLANDTNEGLLFWDYHVFLIAQHKDETLVFDMDTTLPFPVPFSVYAKEAVRNDFDQFQSKRYFKVIDAEKFLHTFSSDRGHMKEDEDWMSPPPPYPPILNEDKVHNLDSFITMNSSDEFGQVLDIDEFKASFS